MTSTAIERAAGTRSFTAVVPLSAAPAKVIDALTTLDGLSAWWGPASGDPTVGGHLSFDFGEHGVNEVRVACAEGDRVVWESTQSPMTPEWVGTTMEWDVIADGTGSELRFTHAGLTPALECYDHCHAGWSHYVASLAAFVDRGAGMPFGS